jgi:hypothetical protein
MIADALDGRGSRESHVGATFHAYRTCHSLWLDAFGCNAPTFLRDAWWE